MPTGARSCWRSRTATARAPAHPKRLTAWGPRESWRELLLRLRDENGLATAPELATGDGALGVWKALREVWPTTRQRRCWIHKTANVLNAPPKSVQGKAKKDLHAIYEAENPADADAAFDRFIGKYGAKYDRAVTCVIKDRAALLGFYDVPAEPLAGLATRVVSQSDRAACGHAMEARAQLEPDREHLRHRAAPD